VGVYVVFERVAARDPLDRLIESFLASCLREDHAATLDAAPVASRSRSEYTAVVGGERSPRVAGLTRELHLAS
jgi:hypothetical protein